MRGKWLAMLTMKNVLLTIVAAALALVTSTAASADDHAEAEKPKWSLAIHGGAGTILPQNITPEQRVAYEAALQEALDAGTEVLANGGSAMDAVKAAIIPMEDNPLFNAGRGAVYTWEGENELDASIMDGRDRSAGAVTGVTTVKNPILLADKVRTDSPHVFLMGEGAEQFAGEQGFDVTPGEWFETERRKQSLERMKARELSALDVDLKFGTVGAVALDQEGNLAAGTSTGGMTGKRWGRIGDAPVIGAGTYADNRSCALSATGWGEYFIRVGVAQEICTQLRVTQERMPSGSLIPEEDETKSHQRSFWHTKAAQGIADRVMNEVKDLGGDGGVILVTPQGDALFSFNTAGMYRGRANSLGLNEVAIFGGEGQIVEIDPSAPSTAVGEDESERPDH
jgi:L-asparaginase / beta-aspartyl-peptidase